MKKIFFILSILTSGLLLSFTNPVIKSETFKVDVEKSNIEWTARKVVGSHNGNIKLGSGSINTNAKGVPSNGKFVIDMKTLTVLDITNESQNQRLVGHLASDDFFSVSKNPSAAFQATKISANGAGKINVEGKLTIKGITNNIKFPATYQLVGNTLTAEAKGVKVDRTKFDIKYRSSSFFESLGDKAIDNEFELNIKLVAVK
jgi:polyisoprenoid-binding protein YceI